MIIQKKFKYSNTKKNITHEEQGEDENESFYLSYPCKIRQHLVEIRKLCLSTTEVHTTVDLKSLLDIGVPQCLLEMLM